MSSVSVVISKEAWQRADTRELIVRMVSDAFVRRDNVEACEKEGHPSFFEPNDGQRICQRCFEVVEA